MDCDDVLEYEKESSSGPTHLGVDLAVLVQTSSVDKETDTQANRLAGSHLGARFVSGRRGGRSEERGDHLSTSRYIFPFLEVHNNLGFVFDQVPWLI